MSVKVKPILFVTTPDDSLVVVDVYAGGSTSSEPLNLLQSVNKSTSSAFNKILGGVNTSGKSIFKKAADLVLSGKSFKSKDFAKEMLGEVFPNAKAALNDLKGSLIGTVASSMGVNADSVLSAYRSVKDGDYDNVLENMANGNPLVKLYLDGQAIVKKAEDVDSLGDLFNVAGAMFGNTDIGKAFNVTNEFKALKGLVDTAISLRAPELADYLIAKTDDTNKERLRRAASHQAAATGDIYTFYGYLYQMNIAEALVEEPEIGVKLISNYRHPTDEGPTLESSNMLVSILNAIDPHWNGQNGSRPNVAIWENVSDEMRELIFLDGRFAHLLIAGDGIKPETLTESVERTMPWVTLKEDAGQRLI